MEPLPAPIKWGRENENCAQLIYKKHMNATGHLGLTVRLCGFIIHPCKCWLGASPDGVVVDPTADINSMTELLEIKYNALMLGRTLNLMKLVNFYCSLDSATGSITLKRDHSYYHQVQLQLYNIMSVQIYTTGVIFVFLTTME